MTWTPESWLYPEAGACRASVGLASPSPLVADLVAVSNPVWDLFGRRALVAYRYDGRWSPRQFLDGRLRDTAPAAISRTPNVTDVFAIGADETDGLLLTWWNVSGTWSGPQPLEGPRGLLSRAAPAVASWHPGRLDVFAVTNPDGLLGPRRLVHWWWEGGPWSTHELIESRLLDISPAVVAPNVGRLNVFAVAADDLEGQIVTIWWPRNERWGGPWPMPGQTRGLVGNGGPAAVSVNPDRIDVVAVSRDGLLIHWWYDGTWRSPEIIDPGRPRLDPAGRPWIARQPGTDNFDVFATREPDGILGSRYVAYWRFTGGALEPQANLFTWVNAFGPIAIYTSPAILHVAAGRDDGRLAVAHADPTYRPPDAPTLSVEALAYNHMRMSWSVPARVVRTEVWSQSQFLFFPTDHKIANVFPPQNTYEENFLYPGGARYCYYVRGYDAEGGFSQSNIACGQMNRPSPTKPSGTATADRAEPRICWWAYSSKSR